VAAAAPIDGESTVEAHVFAQLVKGGMPKEAVNTVELARSIVASGPTAADALLASTADLRALAEGVKARQETYTRALAQQGIALDAAQRFAAELPAAAAYAHDRRVRGYAAGAEHRADSAVAALLRARGASDAAQAQALGAAETGMLRAAAAASSNARLDLARAAAGRSGAARQRVVDSALTALALPGGHHRRDPAVVRPGPERRRQRLERGQPPRRVRGVGRQRAGGVRAVARRRHQPRAGGGAGATGRGAQERALDVDAGEPARGRERRERHGRRLRGLRQRAARGRPDRGGAGRGGLDGRAVADLFVAMRAGVRTP
jgi:hypothetical protein